MWMIGEQCTVDIFLLDWENPKPSTDDMVSVWRMYFVANEWNELQVTRKSSPSVQIIASLLILEVRCFDHVSSCDSLEELFTFITNCRSSIVSIIPTSFRRLSQE